ncbi:ATP-binding protein [Tenacibaculum ovolyticum]|uniref:tetratricopeptide repeat-containing sensor histidine kinase n=1 Tax=Tenacibaculum ovolyticum TaxID=104270 RepID=UPI0022F3BC89|nr:tetratricopeptide repeat-containing sensor histidine kinase [Tenacibaculum ovolyticum]WBX77776.1 ATP-binding protein [Tenacibaculum ovolyticum]
MKPLKKIVFFLLLIYIGNQLCFSTSKYFKFQNDSIKIWINKAKNKKLDSTSRSNLLIKSYNYITNNNKQLPLELSSIAYEFYTLKDTVSFFKINKTALNYATKNKHTYAIGDTHWNYASYYINLEIYDKAYFHFNKAYQTFIKENHKKEASSVLWGMTRIKGYYKDYIGSEILNIKVIELFKELCNYKKLYDSYSHLGLLQHDIKEYDKAVEYYSKAIEYYNKIPKKIKEKSYIEIYNNIGNVYLEKKEFKTALVYYNKELKTKKLKKDQYARVLNNKAYCKLLMKDTINIKKDFFKALKIRDSIGHKIDILSSKIHISYYYKYKKDTINALKYAKEANTLAKKIKNGGYYLTTLKQLANLDTKNTKNHLDRYIAFNDSLISSERRTQNKFTRIEFETDEYIEETERLNQQRIWIIVTSIAGILILSLLYFLRVQKVKNEKLQLESEQQKANEEVYILTLQQKAKLEEEKVKERNRISEELHDGVLGKLFGTRFGLGFLNIKGDDDVLEKHQSFLNELQDIEKEIRDVSHKLNDNFNSDTVNFTFIITQLLKDKSELGGFTYEFNIDNEISWKTTNEVTKANIYRIIQEALQNILKHAKAEKVTLAFSKDDQHIIIELKDNGVGFNSKKGKKGIGIKNIKSRVKKLNGSVEFLSELSKGTSLIIKIPYKFE